MATVKNDVLLPQDVRGYIRQHNIDKTVNSILNDILKKRPEDPVGYMAERFAKSCSSPPQLVSLKPVRQRARVVGGQPTFDIAVSTRGISARVHAVALGDSMFQSGGEEEIDTEAPVDAEARARLEAFLESFFAGAFGQVSIEEFLTFPKLCEGLQKAPPLREGQVLDLARATAALTEGLLVAAARSRDGTCLEFLQELLAKEWRRVSREQGSKGLAELQTPRPLRERGDLAAWRALWPRLALPVFHGGAPGGLRAASFRLCVALTPFAAPALAEREEDHPEDCPAFGWFASTVQALQSIPKEVVKLLLAEKAANCVVNDVPYALPTGLLPTLQTTRRAAEAVLGAEKLAETSVVLLAAAEEAWVAEEGVYEVETGKKLTLEQLVDLYSELAEEGWIGTIVQPFRQEDISAGCELLRARRPELQLVADYGPEEAPPRTPPRGAAFSCALHLRGPAPEMLQRYVELAPAWQAAADGCWRCALLDAPTASALPSALDVVLACRSQVLCLAAETPEEAIAAISSRCDEMFCRLLFDGVAAEST